MALRNKPPEAEPIRDKVASLEGELTTKFSNLFSMFGWLDNDRWDLFYRPAYFGTFTREDRKNCRWIHDHARFGKGARSFGMTYDLYLITMNNLNFGNALAGPGLRYKDGELAKIYINRIIDSSHDMAREIDKLDMEVLKLRRAFDELPALHDAEWERRYNHIENLISGLEEALQECEDAVDQREQLGDQLLVTWFPEVAAEQAKVYPKMEVQAETDGSPDSPYLMVISPDDPDYRTEMDITELVDDSDRDTQTWFTFPVSEADRGKTWRFNFRTTPSQDWDTHVELYAGDRFQSSRNEMVAPTPHSIEVVPNSQTTDIMLRLEHWQRIPNQTRGAVLTVEVDGFEDDGGV